ncbi:DUF6134 family protein [Plastoroseomonas arctica]|uniref:Uncharacterized protein n=1 Tax=Plastoroseomonas arctica TaxID=1509237 RepID=A0AAF1KPE9_9PROT|nr:DUF6134 family protein [Plastoroseomonas arctica]MBR0655843.1 hypothetical protein [Plastoroseomonas arctica]
MAAVAEGEAMMAMGDGEVIQERSRGTRRRAVLAAPALLLAARARAEEGDFSFRVMRRGEQVGTHTVHFAQAGRERVATSEFLVVPRVLGIVVYRFEHRYEEVTEGGRFRRVTSRLNRNGRIVEVRGEAVAGAVLLDGTEGPQRLPAEAAPLSWWEPQRLGRVPIFGTTTGKLLAITWEVGREARVCHGEVEAVARYDAAGRWVGFSARGEDGNDIEYAPA